MGKIAETIEASRVVVLGRGVKEVEPGQWRLSSGSKIRAETMLEYYHSNKKLFRRMGARIVCSGSHGGLALKQAAPPPDVSEARGMADILIGGDVPPGLIGVEGQSISTFSNYEEIVRAELFPEEMPFTPEDPLLVVTSNSHGKYRAIPIARAAFGIKEQEAVGLLPAEKEPPLTNAREMVGGLATMLAIREIGVVPYSEEHLRRAGDRFAEFTEHPTLLLPALAKDLR